MTVTSVMRTPRHMTPMTLMTLGSYCITAGTRGDGAVTSAALLLRLAGIGSGAMLESAC
jgi:hypothetical protein